MYTCLSPGAIGIRTTLPEAIKLAAETGFEALEFNIREAADMADQHGATHVKELFAASGIRIGNWGFPVDFRRDDATYQTGMAGLPRLAQVAQQLGATRCATWMHPFSDELRFVEHFDLMVKRLRPAAQVLADHGIRFGLEFVGPRTLRQAHKYSFISTMEGMLGLCGAIGTGNLGLLVDCFQWYTAHGTAQDITSLRNEDVVLVHINDGIAGRGPDEQMVRERTLPGETGVIDMAAFLKGLTAIGYDGPVVVEPCSKRVEAMQPHDAATATRESVERVYRAGELKCVVCDHKCGRKPLFWWHAGELQLRAKGPHQNDGLVENKRRTPMPAPLAIQLYTLREALSKDFVGVVNRVASIGYVGVEPGVADTTEEAIRLFRDLGLVVPSAHLPLPLGEQKGEVLDTMASLGCKRLVSAIAPNGPDDFATIDAIKRTCSIFNEASAVAADNGLSFGIHTHWWEFQKVEGRFAYEVMLECLDPDVFFEVDTYWTRTAGCDPAEIVRQLGRRAPLLHIKDGPCIQGEPMTAVGEGIMDFSTIVQAGAESTEWMIVELDSCATDMLEAVDRSYKYLVSNGWSCGKSG